MKMIDRKKLYLLSYIIHFSFSPLSIEDQFKIFINRIKIIKKLIVFVDFIIQNIKFQ